MFENDFTDFIVGYHTAQPIGTEDQPVARLQGEMIEVHSYSRPGSQRTSKNMMIRIRGRLRRGEQSGINLFLGDGMICSPPFDFAIADQIGPAVAHIGDVRPLIVQQGSSDS